MKQKYEKSCGGADINTCMCCGYQSIITTGFLFWTNAFCDNANCDNFKVNLFTGVKEW